MDDKKTAFLDKLSRRVNAEISDILGRANVERDRIISTAKSEVEKYKNTPLSELKDVETIVFSTVKPKRKGKKINVEEILLIQKNIDVIFNQAEKKLVNEAKAPGYQEALKFLFDEALDGVGKDIVLTSNKKDSIHIKKMASSFSGEVEFKTDDSINGGLIAMSKDGRTKNVNTLSSRMERIRRFAVKDVNKILYV